MQTPQYVRRGASLTRVQPPQPRSAAKAGVAARVLARAVTDKRATPLRAARTAASARSSSTTFGAGKALLCLGFCRCGQIRIAPHMEVACHHDASLSLESPGVCRGAWVSSMHPVALQDRQVRCASRGALQAGARQEQGGGVPQVAGGRLQLGGLHPAA